MLSNNTQIHNDFKEAFIKIYKYKPVHQIKVVELCKKAGYSRGTFYLHFKSVYHLLDTIESDLLQKLKVFCDFQTNPQSMQVMKEGGIPESTFKWFESCKENGPFLIAVLGPHGNPSFTYKLKENIFRQILETLLFDNAPDDIRTRYAVELQASGIIGMVRYFLENSLNNDTSELVHAYNALRKFRILWLNNENTKKM